jgi:cell filamentation protein
VLRNRASLRTHEELAEFETSLTRQRVIELASGLAVVEEPYTFDSYLAVHHYIFRDVYEWAGELRTVNIEKDGARFQEFEVLGPLGVHIFRTLRDSGYLRGFERGDFVLGSAQFFCELNNLHPFREGNGRAQRLMLLLVGRAAGWDIEWRAITPRQNLEASTAGFRADVKPMRALLDTITRPWHGYPTIADELSFTGPWLDAQHESTPEPGIDL